VSVVGWLGAGLGGAGAAILAWTAAGRTPVPVDPGFEAFRAGWRRAHRLPEGGADPGGRVTLAWLRVPWAVALPLARRGVDPDRLTLCALWVALVAGWTAALGPGWAAAAGTLTLLAGLGDGLDGAVAVLTRRTSTFGFVWDSTADRLADLALVAGPVALVVGHGSGAWPALAAGAGAAAAALTLLLEYVRARAQAGGVPGAWTLVTPGERPVRVIVLGVTGLAVGAAQAVGGPLARAALLAGYPLALAVLAVLEAAGCVRLLLAARRPPAPT
jgi:CDP-diacylglycerol--glycerol-3-phosphate 3-phosphatidyltransferase